MHILTINAGSSSLRFTLFKGDKPRNLKAIYRGHVDAIGQDHCRYRRYLKNTEESTNIEVKTHKEAIEYAIKKLEEDGAIENLKDIKKVAHRVVHGGEQFTAPTKIGALMLRKLAKLNDLAPLHNPANLEGIQAARAKLKRAQHFAIFDTAFHANLPEHAYLYGLPYKLYKKQGIRRYGFHGTSHKYVAEQARKQLKKRNCKLITCHMGNGISVAAIKNGICLDTSMGFTPLEGPPMGTRSGSFDPAILLHLAKQGYNWEDLHDLIQNKSGLLGLSEISSDVRHLRDRIHSTETQRAFGVLAYQMAKQISAYFAPLGGPPDAVVFTGGIGEHADYLRKMTLDHLKGFKLKSLVIPTNEELQMAREIL